MTNQIGSPESRRVWHLEPSPTDPDTIYAGVEDAALFRSTDGGDTWQELPGLRGHESGSKWQPGAGGMCLHTVLPDPSTAERMFIAISAAVRSYGSTPANRTCRTNRPTPGCRTRWGAADKAAIQLVQVQPCQLPKSDT